MNVDFLTNSEIAVSLENFSDDTEEQEKEENSKYLQILNKMKNKKIHYDYSDDEYYYSSEDVNSYLLQRFKARISYYKNLKRKHQLSDEIDNLIIKYLEYMYYEKSVNYNYFIKKICNYLKVPCNIKIKRKKKKYESMWCAFIKINYK